VRQPGSFEILTHEPSIRQVLRFSDLPRRRQREGRRNSAVFRRLALHLRKPDIFRFRHLPQSIPPSAGASLIWRVFLEDVLERRRCHGMTIVAALTSPPAIERILRHLGLPTAAPQLHPARPPPQLELQLDREPAPFYADPPAPEVFDET